VGLGKVGCEKTKQKRPSGHRMEGWNPNQPSASPGEKKTGSGPENLYLRKNFIIGREGVQGTSIQWSTWPSDKKGVAEVSRLSMRARSGKEILKPLGRKQMASKKKKQIHFSVRAERPIWGVSFREGTSITLHVNQEKRGKRTGRTKGALPRVKLRRRGLWHLRV